MGEITPIVGDITPIMGEITHIMGESKMAGTTLQALLVVMTTARWTAAQLSSNQQSLFYLFERPYDPLWRNTRFNLPNDLREGFESGPPSGAGVDLRVGQGTAGVGGTFQLAAPSVFSSSDQIEVSLTDVDVQALGPALTVRRGVPYSMFIPSHRQAASSLIEYFSTFNNPRSLSNAAANVKRRVNEAIWVYSLAHVITTKQEFRSIPIPSVMEMLPAMFLPGSVLAECDKQAVNAQSADNAQRDRVIVNHGREFSGTEQNPEQRLAYFREDYGINAHHWYWHLIYPIELNSTQDRKGELFYYMHQQIVARYDMERLSLGMNRVTRLENLREPIPEGYFSKLTLPSGRSWGSRQDNTILRNFERPLSSEQLIPPFDITDLERWRGLIMDAINQAVMINRTMGERVPLMDDLPRGSTMRRGIEILGDTVEADADRSLNYGLYGDLHNLGHVAIAFSHDPDGRHDEQMGVMATSGTAMRDPIFYRWHKFIDGIFQSYKSRLPPYTRQQLSMDGVTVREIRVVNDITREVNNLQTGWGAKLFNASRGLTFGDGSVPVWVNVTHLDNKPFTYHIQVDNSGSQRPVVVRIFLAPKRNERGQIMPYSDQRLLWTELDRFSVRLLAGRNHIVRASIHSSVTTTANITFGAIEGGNRTGQQPLESDYCGCGWPQHMLLPRGTPEGMEFQLFVMITDFTEDYVEDSAPTRCGDAFSFCGVLGRRYPDRRPMGFPFDRIIDFRIGNIQNFTRILSNAAVQDIRVTFLNRFFS